MSRIASRARIGASLVVVFLAATAAAGTGTSPARRSGATATSSPSHAQSVASRKNARADSSRAGFAGAPRATVPGAALEARDSGATSADLTLKGGQEGTVFRSLTVEGEDRIHVEIERPELTLDLDPQKAPGLEWGSARDVLDRTTPDLASPLVALSSRERSPYPGRPWLSEFASGPVARFEPAVQGVERWKLTVVDAHGQAAIAFTGSGNPPRSIPWDGRSQSGSPVAPGLTYSYVFEAYDRAGNKRNFVGQGFSVSAYRLETPQGTALLFSAHPLVSWLAARDLGGATTSAAVPPILLEAASWLNQSESINRPIQVMAHARTYEQANRLAGAVARALGPLVIGDPARLRAVAMAEPDAPEEGTLAIRPGP